MGRRGAGPATVPLHPRHSPDWLERPARSSAGKGLWNQEGVVGVGESDLTKCELCLTGGGGFTLSGLVCNTIWTATQNFNVSSAGSIVAYLVECNPDGTGCVQIASTTVTRADWDVGDTGTWIQDTFNFGFVNYTLGPGKAVGFKGMVGAGSGGAMGVAYDTTSYPALGQLVILAPGISVNPTSGLTTTEAGGAAAVPAVLESGPTAHGTNRL